jgi:hypothetical protein
MGVRLKASSASATGWSRRSPARSRTHRTPNRYTATRHQREVGAGYFDRVLDAVSRGQSSTLALKGSTEEVQFTATKEVANVDR